MLKIRSYTIHEITTALPKSRLSGHRTARGSERDKNSINLNGVALSSWIKYGTNSDFILSLCAARYRERFCTQRFLGFKTQNCLLGKPNHTEPHEKNSK